MFVLDNEYEEYPYSAQIMLEDANPDLVPLVNFSLSDVLSGNYAPISLSLDKSVKIFAKSIPAETLTIPSIVLY